MARKFKIGDVVESKITVDGNFKKGHRGTVDHINTRSNIFPYSVIRRGNITMFDAKELKLVQRAKK